MGLNGNSPRFENEDAASRETLSMFVDELLEHIPPVARYRCEPLEDGDNALFYWDQAASVMFEADDDVSGTD